MLFYGTSDIVTAVTSAPLADGSPSERLSLRGGPVLVITEKALGLYRDEDAPDDPLGNGLLALCDFPGTHRLTPHDGRFVREHRAGYVGLMDGHVILVTPAAIQLFANQNDALRNRDQLARLAFED